MVLVGVLASVYLDFGRPAQVGALLAASPRYVVSVEAAALAFRLLMRGVGIGRLIAAGAAAGLIRLVSAPL